ncbi:hypothetical protein RR46_04413 [Papilio xuthus]|uniref:Uncharacterized protein n=1 Tax=Papilio xuthus TaxID=66420 RepID=A0A194PT85_PAPXU|nr:hypothetical protein RR46_04413 [Papilio xuthus]
MVLSGRVHAPKRRGDERNGVQGHDTSLPRQRSMGVVVTMKMPQASCELRVMVQWSGEARNERGSVASRAHCRPLAR